MILTLSNRFLSARGWLFLPAIALLAGCTGERTGRDGRGHGSGTPDGAGDSAGDSDHGPALIEVSASGAFDEAGVLTVDLGDVRLYSSATARFTLRNIGTGPVTIVGADYTADITGGDWLPPGLLGGLPATLDPDGTVFLGVAYQPVVEGLAFAEVRVLSDVAARVMVRVRAHGVYDFEPDIEIEYNGFVGPTAADCADRDGDGVNDGCVMPEPLNFGGVALGSTAAATVVIRNLAACDAPLGGDPCHACQLVIGPDNSIPGLTIEDNPDGYFDFLGSSATPFAIRQADSHCVPAQNGEVRLRVSFNPPDTLGDFGATLVIRTNVPSKPLIEIPMVAHTSNLPIAVAGFRLFDPSDPGGDHTDPSEIVPLTRVYFDGRAKGIIESSHDPTNPLDPSLIVRYRWRVIEAPAGVNPADFNPSPPILPGADYSEDNIGFFSFWPPLAGHYSVRLEVENRSGSWSDPDQVSARVEFDCVPTDRLHVQLTWDDPSSNQDLHLTYSTVDDNVCDIPWDCHWGNRTPIWSDLWPAGEGGNPSLDIDDLTGLGPENIVIEFPEPGTYRIYVHDFNDSGTTRNTVRVYINGVLAAEYSRELGHKVLWAVATITWYPDYTVLVTPYPSDVAGEAGALATMPTCDGPPGFDFSGR